MIKSKTMLYDHPFHFNVITLIQTQNKYDSINHDRKRI